jgi:hypothetical protein
MTTATPQEVIVIDKRAKNTIRKKKGGADYPNFLPCPGSSLEKRPVCALLIQNTTCLLKLFQP